MINATARVMRDLAMVISTWESMMQAESQVKAYTLGLLVTHMTVSGKMESSTDTESGRAWLVTAISVSGSRTKPMVTASTSGPMAIAMKASGSSAWGMDRVRILSLTEISTWASTTTAGQTGTGSTDGKTETLTLEYSLKEWKRVRVCGRSQARMR